VVPALPRFLQQHPELSLQVSMNDRFVDLVQEGIDAALRVGNLTDSSLIAKRVALLSGTTSTHRSKAASKTVSAPSIPTASSTANGCARASSGRTSRDFGALGAGVLVRCGRELGHELGDGVQARAVVRTDSRRSGQPRTLPAIDL
jgi:DNA-binding transcriptional LysR family regulator